MRLLAAALLALGPAVATAADVFAFPATAQTFERDVATATRVLRDAQVLRGQYEQEKRLKGVPRPLKAEGDFLFARGRGIAWMTRKPFESELVITTTDIIQREGGRVSMRLSAAQQPSVRVVADVFAAVFALDFDALAARFKLYSRTVPGGWELGLRPHDGQGGALRQIVVSGGKHVQRVRVSDTNGDETAIRLRNTVVANKPATAEELKRFTP
ncbi:MAG TPA: outer membrane lipoprotein carrier protein LolA [Verrucomicrobiae bacterium]|nr:outer membrane lipoprotein carrier protein LolA [Verrucomicrobiae bacterium]